MTECADCGMMKVSNDCLECRKAEALLVMANLLAVNDLDPAPETGDSGNVVSESKEMPDAYQSISDSPDARSVSDLLSVPTDSSLIASYLRRHMIKYKIKEDLFKHADQQISFKVPPSEVKKAKQAIDLFDDIANIHIVKFNDHIDLLYQPFTDYKGVKPEQAVDASMHFKIFIDTTKSRLTDLKNKLIKALDILEDFSSDSNIASMLNSMSDTINNTDKQINLLENVIEELNTEDFQENIIKVLEAIKKEVLQLKQLIVESVIDYIRTHILQQDWTTEIKEEVVEEKGEQNNDN
jgi:hypothetical protein